MPKPTTPKATSKPRWLTWLTTPKPTTAKPTTPKLTTPKTEMPKPTTWSNWPSLMNNKTDLVSFEQNRTIGFNKFVVRHLTTFFGDWFDKFNVLVSSVIGFFLMILFGYTLFACCLTSFCHANKKLGYPRNDYRYLPSCIRKKFRERSNTIVSYPSTRSGLDRLEQAKLDQELRREKIRLGEPIYEEIPLKGVAKLKKFFAKKKLVSNPKELHVVQVHAPETSHPKIKQANKVSKLISFFSKKKNPSDNVELKTFRAKSRIDNYMTNAQKLEKAYKTRPKKTAGVHKPYVLTPSFVFGTGIEPAYDTFPLATWSPPNTSLKIAQSALDSGDVVLSFSNETYEEPKAFSTFKPSSPVRPNFPVPNLIEIDPNQSEQRDFSRPVRPSMPDPDLIEIDPNQPAQ